MSFLRETSSSMPKLVGGGMLIAGLLSTLSLSVDGPAVINFPGGTFWDVVGGIASIGAGFLIWGERSPIAAWLGAGLLILGLTSAGWEFNTAQAGNMAMASVEAIKAGAKAGAAAGSSQAGKSSYSAAWNPVRKLTDDELKWCKQGNNSTSNAAARVNCTPASDGAFYKWSRG